ncbi:hypothetical protein XELAEV_18002424mg [Xenopus laevis]|nr:hypothetical protein XELAEV_18002424mg [Xenopus laevis]
MICFSGLQQAPRSHKTMLGPGISNTGVSYSPSHSPPSELQDWWVCFSLTLMCEVTQVYPTTDFMVLWVSGFIECRILRKETSFEQKFLALSLCNAFNVNFHYLIYYNDTLFMLMSCEVLHTFVENH